MPHFLHFIHIFLFYSSCGTKAAKCSGGLTWPMFSTIYLKLNNLSLHNKWPARALLGEVNAQSTYPSSTCGKVEVSVSYSGNTGRGSCSELPSISKKK
jgi:hypothetical protein